MNSLSRWSDDRLDGLENRLGRIEPVVTEVAVLKTELVNLTRELRANTHATHEVADQMEKAQIEPVVRMRNFRSALAIGIASAVVGGLLALVAALVAAHGG